MSHPDIPPVLKPIQHYLKIAGEHDQRDPVVAYWCRLYALQAGMKIDRTAKECLVLLTYLMDWLEKAKIVLKDNEAVTNDLVGQAHVENCAHRLFTWADNEDRNSRFNKNTVKAFYTAGYLYDVCATFGDLSEEIQQRKKYAKWKAAYIHTCLKNGVAPTPGPENSVDEIGFNIDADLFENLVLGDDASTFRLRIEFKPVLNVANILLKYSGPPIDKIVIEKSAVSFYKTDFVGKVMFKDVVFKPETMSSFDGRKGFIVFRVQLEKLPDSLTGSPSKYLLKASDLYQFKCRFCGFDLTDEVLFKNVFPFSVNVWKSMGVDFFCHKHDGDSKNFEISEKSPDNALFICDDSFTLEVFNLKRVSVKDNDVLCRRCSLKIGTMGLEGYAQLQRINVETCGSKRSSMLSLLLPHFEGSDLNGKKLIIQASGKYFRILILWFLDECAVIDRTLNTFPCVLSVEEVLSRKCLFKICDSEEDLELFKSVKVVSFDEVVFDQLCLTLISSSLYYPLSTRLQNEYCIGFFNH